MSDATVGQGMELLSCPFCGAQPEYDFFLTSQCPHELYCDKCIGIVATQQKQLDKAVAAWNRRAPASAQGASVPSDIAETIRIALSGTRKRAIDLTHWDYDHERRTDAALTWLAQQRGQG